MNAHQQRIIAKLDIKNQPEREWSGFMYDLFMEDGSHGGSRAWGYAETLERATRDSIELAKSLFGERIEIDIEIKNAETVRWPTPTSRPRRRSRPSPTP